MHLQYDTQLITTTQHHIMWVEIMWPGSYVTFPFDNLFMCTLYQLLFCRITWPSVDHIDVTWPTCTSHDHWSLPQFTQTAVGVSQRMQWALWMVEHTSTAGDWRLTESYSTTGYEVSGLLGASYFKNFYGFFSCRSFIISELPSSKLCISHLQEATQERSRQCARWTWYS